MSNELHRIAVERIMKMQDETSAKYLKNIGGKLLPYLAIPTLVSLTSYFSNKNRDQQEMSSLLKSFQTIKEIDPEMARDPNFPDRFNELRFISPTVANNPAMAARFLKNRIKSGLTLDDVHKLSIIESTGKKATPPASARALAAGGLAFDRMLGTFGLETIRDTSRLTDQYKKDMKEHAGRFEKFKNALPNKHEEDHMKTSSQKVSDACLGEMLADRFIVMKQGLQKEAGRKEFSVLNALKAGGSRVGKGIAFMAPLMALGGVVHAAGALADKKARDKQEILADKNFQHLKATSEIVKGNPLLAQEAADAIKTFAPALAAKPLVLKAFVEHTVNTETLPYQTVSDLAVAQANVHKSQVPGFAAGFFNAVKNTGDAGKIFKAQVGDKEDIEDAVSNRW